MIKPISKENICGPEDTQRDLSHSELAVGEKNRPNIEQYFESVADWIDSVCEKFAQGCKLDAIDSTFKRN